MFYAFSKINSINYAQILFNILTLMLLHEKKCYIVLKQGSQTKYRKAPYDTVCTVLN